MSDRSAQRAGGPDPPTAPSEAWPLEAPAVLEPSIDDRKPVDPGAPVAAVATAINRAGWELWSTHPDLATDGNAVISPSSIGHSLLMMRAAADASTAAAIDIALGFPAQLAAHEGWNAIDQAIATAAERHEDLTVTMADRIWPRLDIQPSQYWIDLLAAYHGTTVQPFDFAGSEPESRAMINGWVSDQTRGLIPAILPRGFLTAATRLVLTDAVYFKARWAVPFRPSATTRRPFTLLDGPSLDVEMMRHLKLGSRRGAGQGYVGAEVPYAGGEFSMLVIVPDEGRFSEVRGRLGSDLLEEIDASFTPGPFELLLPRWKVRTNGLGLMGWFNRIGAAPGQYPRITRGAELEAAVHGAVIIVDEWGTEAAAATSVGFRVSRAREPELTIAADKPFLYLIRHLPTGLVLFLGQVTDPAGP